MIIDVGVESEPELGDLCLRLKVFFHNWNRREIVSLQAKEGKRISERPIPKILSAVDILSESIANISEFTVQFDGEAVSCSVANILICILKVHLFVVVANTQDLALKPL